MYNTVKPLYTVYRTTETEKQKEMVGRKVLFTFESILINSQRWRWCDVARQTVPEMASSHRKRMIADSGQPCTSDH